MPRNIRIGDEGVASASLCCDKHGHSGAIARIRHLPITEYRCEVHQPGGTNKAMDPLYFLFSQSLTLSKPTGLCGSRHASPIGQHDRIRSPYSPRLTVYRGDALLARRKLHADVAGIPLFRIPSHSRLREPRDRDVPSLVGCGGAASAVGSYARF